jgi:UDP-2,4-diacetamido-2,4,6-trideoxy-beta-L-altropyranose hydrolase
VTLGGADPANITQAVCEAIAESAFASRCSFTVLVGPQNPHRASLTAAVSSLTGQWRVESGRHDLSDFFQLSDLAITSASVTLYEMACVGLPFMAIQTADNQRLVAESIQHSEAGVLACSWPAASSGIITECFDAFLADPERLGRASVAGPGWIDGRGADRIVRRLMAGKLRVRFGRPDDASALWHLRNDPLVRANSLSQDPVGWSTHRDWLERLLDDPLRRLFVLTNRRDEVVGQCRLDFEPARASVTISIALVKTLRGSSVGAGLIHHALAMLPTAWQCDRLVAEVRHDNQPSRALFESLGFASVGQASSLSTETRPIRLIRPI